MQVYSGIKSKEDPFPNLLWLPPVERWNFLTKHARALLCIARDPDVRLRDIALNLGITERRAYAIVADLTAAGLVASVVDVKLPEQYIVVGKRP